MIRYRPIMGGALEDEDEALNELDAAFSDESQLEVDSEIEVADETPEPEDAAEYIEFEGARYTPAAMRQMAEAIQWANENPQRWQDLADMADGKAQIVRPRRAQRTEADEYVPDAEYADPDLTAIKQRLDRHEEYLRQRERAEAASAVQAGLATFRGSHPNLTEDEFLQVQGEAARLDLVTSLRARHPERSKTEVLTQALDHAYRIVFFDKHRSEASKQVVTDMRARRRAASSGNSSASVGRNEPEPSNPQERDAAMVAAISQALSNQ